MRRLARPGRFSLSGRSVRSFPRGVRFTTRGLAEASSLAYTPVSCPGVASRRTGEGVLVESIIS